MVSYPQWPLPALQLSFTSNVPVTFSPGDTDIFWVNSITTSDGDTYYQDDTYASSDTKVVNLLDQTNIAWKSDIETKFKNIDEADRVDSNLYLWQNPRYRFVIPMYENQPAISNVTAWTSPAPAFGVQDEHFIVWMRTAGLPSFRKLYGRIETDLAAGTKLQFLVSSSTLCDRMPMLRVWRVLTSMFVVMRQTSWSTRSTARSRS